MVRLGCYAKRLRITSLHSPIAECLSLLRSFILWQNQWGSIFLCLFSSFTVMAQTIENKQEIWMPGLKKKICQHHWCINRLGQVMLTSVFTSTCCFCYITNAIFVGYLKCLSLHTQYLGVELLHTYIHATPNVSYSVRGHVASDVTQHYGQKWNLWWIDDLTFCSILTNWKENGTQLSKVPMFPGLL